MFNEAVESGSTVLMYNNVIVNKQSGGMVTNWLTGNTSSFSGTGYVFNNVFYLNAAGNYLNIGPHAGSFGTWNFFNNTLECGIDSSTGVCGSGATPLTGTFNFNNNHFITSTTPAISCPGGATCNNGGANLTQSVSTANGQGYTSSQTYAFSPANSSGGTVGTGTNEQAICTAIGSATVNGLPNAAAWAQAACQSDTAYACSYNTSNHTLSCPNRTPNARPVSGAWDIGAFLYSTQNPPNPPTGLSAVVN